MNQIIHTPESVLLTILLLRNITVNKHFDPITLETRFIARGELRNYN